MLFKLHYFLLTSGVCAMGILLGVFIETYTDANSFEIGALLMVMPFTGMIFRPIICSMADRQQAHQTYMIQCLFVVVVSYSPFIVIPYLGPQVYEEHPRICWYIFVVFKVVGDIAFGGMLSIGDALAINYAKRIGNEFSVYRIWGTISWMLFGCIIGQINEIPIVPKYVPGFAILIISSILDMTIIWLWPKEYFEMVPMDLKALEEEELERERNIKCNGGKKSKKENAMTKSLMPKEVVIAQMKNKIRSLIFCAKKDEQLQQQNEKSQVAQLSILDAVELQKQQQQQQVVNELAQPAPEPIDKRTQLRILAMLLRRDPRIVLYLTFFMFTGFGFAALSFFIISLSNICHQQGTCQFSELTGYIQVTMASFETVLFIYIKWVKSFFGRVNLCMVVLTVIAIKYLFYGTYFSQVSPYYSLLAESLHGLAFGINLTLMTEMGHLFANEVELIIPELMARGFIKDNSPLGAERLKLSLSATMQALMTTACDCLGRGLGALILGLLLEFYTFKTLWLMIGIGASILLVITIIIKLFDTIFKPQLGLDVQAKLKEKQTKENIAC